MGKAIVRFLPDDVTIEATTGKLLLDVALEAGIFIRAACGGSGGCGQCKVRVAEGEVQALNLGKLDAQEQAEGFVRKKPDLSGGVRFI